MRVAKLLNGEFVTPSNVRGRHVVCPRCGGVVTIFKVRGVEYFKHVNAQGCDGSRNYLRS